jgi:hypothetical protein
MKVTGHKDIKTLMKYVKITASVVEAEFARSWAGPDSKYSDLRVAK